MSSYRITTTGESRSFPESHAFLEAAQKQGDGIVVLGPKSGSVLADRSAIEKASFIAVELGTECLAAHGGLEAASGFSNLVGFARFRLGKAAPSKLVELVKQPWTKPEAVNAARAAFEASGLTVAVCEDFPGRIIDRLIRPYLNAALRRLDERLATAGDLDKTLRMGLGYPEGPIALLERTGLVEHFDVTQALYEALGQEPYAPARAARVAKERVGTK